MTDNNELNKQKIMEILDAVRSQSSDHDLGHLIASDHAKLIECRHEILISVMANIMEEDDTGQLVGSKEICKKNYHIPVPSDKDYNHYLKGFFDFLEGCMKNSIDHANQTSKDKEEHNNE